jgi:type VI secretion system protein ImpA
MSSIDLESLLGEISAESPCGEDLSYDPAYAELDRAVQGTPEQQVGDQVISAQEPNWRDVREKALELLGRTRDLRVIVDLSLGLMMTAGLPGLRDGLELLCGVLQKHWEGVFPRLDVDDNLDPTERTNIIASLSPESSYQDPYRFPQRILDVPLCSSAQMGSYCMRDVMVAKGETGFTGEGEPPNLAQIDAAFAGTEPDVLKENVNAVLGIEELITQIDNALTERVGVGSAPDFGKLQDAVRQVRGMLSEKAAQLFPSEPAAGAAAEGATSTAAAAAPAAAPLSGEISSRDDVIRALDKVVEYYRRHEPSSPVPLLVRRARRLAQKDFMGIIQDMIPDAMAQLEVIGGAEAGSGGETGE